MGSSQSFSLGTTEQQRGPRPRENERTARTGDCGLWAIRIPILGIAAVPDGRGIHAEGPSFPRLQAGSLLRASATKNHNIRAIPLRESEARRRRARRPTRSSPSASAASAMATGRDDRASEGVSVPAPSVPSPADRSPGPSRGISASGPSVSGGTRCRIASAHTSAWRPTPALAGAARKRRRMSAACMAAEGDRIAMVRETRAGFDRLRHPQVSITNTLHAGHAMRAR
ncbi:hypothetical protein DFJ74DRAFT_50897 [Hyaloraphidium curvatum]|nr:hypothetical protein DFJ74DRAFT_50897 [Hyaloraphidium curvatum]